MQSLRARVGLRSDEGFTLIEMVVAIALVSVSLLALLGAFMTTAASIQKQQYRAKAIRAALDMNEHLRLTSYDSTEMALGTHSGTTTVVDGTRLTYTYEVVERSAGTGATGDIVKEVRTTYRWGGPHPGSVTYVTALAEDAKDIGLPAGYIQSIRSMAVTPAPSTVVDYNGFTATDIIVTLVLTGLIYPMAMTGLILTGHTTNDVVHITWQDDRGASSPTVTATSTNGYQWVANVGRGATGIHLQVPGGLDPATGKGYFKNLVFTATTDTGLTATSTLPVYGPTENPPVITSFAVQSTGTNDIKVAKGGTNQFLNSSAVTATCTVTGLTSASDTVVFTYYDALGTRTEVNLTPTTTPVSAGGSTWTKTFAKTTTYFYYADVKPAQPTLVQDGCTVTRAVDGGPAAVTVQVSVHT